MTIDDNDRRQREAKQVPDNVTTNQTKWMRDNAEEAAVMQQSQ